MIARRHRVGGCPQAVEASSGCPRENEN